MQSISIEGVTLELDITDDGMLTVTQDGVMKGQLLLVEPPVPQPQVEPGDFIAVEEEPVLPDGWYRDDAGHLMHGGAQDADGNWTGGTPVHPTSTPEES